MANKLEALGRADESGTVKRRIVDPMTGNLLSRSVECKSKYFKIGSESVIAWKEENWNFFFMALVGMLRTTYFQMSIVISKLN